MKKIKNLFLMAIFTICSFAIIGTVNAAGEASNPDIVCIPNELEVGDTSTCYFLAQIKGEVEGFLTKVYIMDGLVIDEKLEKNIVASPDSNATTLILDYGETGEIKQGVSYKCDTTGEEQAENAKTKQQLCAIFHSGKFTNDSGKSTEENEDLKDYSNKGIVATFNVRLDENLNTCGRICISAKYVPIYGAGETGTGSYTEPSSPGATVCDEIDPKNPENLPTGAFTSYIVLIAGAIIAIASISIAKKQKKMFNV